MKKIRLLFIVFLMLGLMGILAGCLPPTPAGPCEFTANMALSAYRLPVDTSQFFGTMSSGETYRALARTADGWVGFDPGIAQAGNIGLAHHRWVQLNATLSSSCLSSVDLVTISEVEADIAASGS
jgi:hypothetical protein